MSESPQHKKIKEILTVKLKEWFGPSVSEYQTSGHEADVFGVTYEGIKICIEVIWSHSTTQFLKDMIIILQSDADVKIVIGSPEVVNDQKLAREYSKIAIAEIRKGYNMSDEILDGDKILSDSAYVDSELRTAINSLIGFVKSRSEQTTVKEPKLDLELIDPEGNASKEICVEPTYVKVRREIIKRSYPSFFFPRLWVPIPRIPSLFAQREPDEDLLPINIEVSNSGSAPAENILIHLDFPEECELFSESQAIGGLGATWLRRCDGLDVEKNNKSRATAWIRGLGNDRAVSDFSPIYVRFPEREEKYPVTVNILQYNFSPQSIVCHIHVKPKTKEKVERVFEDELGKTDQEETEF